MSTKSTKSTTFDPINLSPELINEILFLNQKFTTGRQTQENLEFAQKYADATHHQRKHFKPTHTSETRFRWVIRVCQTPIPKSEINDKIKKSLNHAVMEGTDPVQNFISKFDLSNLAKDSKIVAKQDCGANFPGMWLEIMDNWARLGHVFIVGMEEFEV